MKIAKREKRIIFALGVFILLILYYAFILSPAFSKINTVEKQIAKNESQLAEIVKLKAIHDRYNESKIKAESILVERGENFAVLSYLESESRKLNIDKRIGFMKPVNFPPSSGNLQLAGIEMNLVGINTKELVDFLHKIEAAGKLLSISRIKIQRPTKHGPQLLNVTLQVNTYNYTGTFPQKVKKPSPKSKLPTPVKIDPASDVLKKAMQIPNHKKSDAEFVSFIYLSILNHKPSSKYHAYWVNKLRKGTSREDIIQYFFQSDHYMSYHKSYHQFVRDLYITILNRVPSQSEVDYWVMRLNKGEKRDGVIHAFFDSEEYRKKNNMDLRWFVDWLKFLK